MWRSRPNYMCQRRRRSARCRSTSSRAARARTRSSCTATTRQRWTRSKDSHECQVDQRQHSNQGEGSHEQSNSPCVAVRSRSTRHGRGSAARTRLVHAAAGTRCAHSRRRGCRSRRARDRAQSRIWARVPRWAGHARRLCSIGHLSCGAQGACRGAGRRDVAVAAGDGRERRYRASEGSGALHAGGAACVVGVAARRASRACGLPCAACECSCRARFRQCCWVGRVVACGRCCARSGA